jgi:lysophospholipase L1-like esterase
MIYVVVDELIPEANSNGNERLATLGFTVGFVIMLVLDNALGMTRAFERFVAVGDSTTEGVGDPYPDGSLRGWTDRLAGFLAEASPHLTYANLAVRGRQAAQIRAEQLEPALALRPDLAVVTGGTNDLLRPRVSLGEVVAHVEAMQRAFIDAGAVVVTFTLPDLSAFMPIARFVRTRLRAFNAAQLELGARTGALVADLAAEPVAADPRLWTPDRLHPNADGHARIAAAMADLLDLPGADDAWREPLPPVVPARLARVRTEIEWSGRHFAPWLLRRARGRSSGDGVVAKRPDLAPPRSA